MTQMSYLFAGTYYIMKSGVYFNSFHIGWGRTSMEREMIGLQRRNPLIGGIKVILKKSHPNSFNEVCNVDIQNVMGINLKKICRQK